MGHIVKEWTMDKKDFNYQEKLYWAKKWNRSTNKILVRIKFTNKYPLAEQFSRNPDKSMIFKI